MKKKIITYLVAAGVCISLATAAEAGFWHSIANPVDNAVVKPAEKDAETPVAKDVGIATGAVVGAAVVGKGVSSVAKTGSNLAEVGEDTSRLSTTAVEGDVADVADEPVASKVRFGMEEYENPAELAERPTEEVINDAGRTFQGGEGGLDEVENGLMEGADDVGDFGETVGEGVADSAETEGVGLVTNPEATLTSNAVDVGEVGEDVVTNPVGTAEGVGTFVAGNPEDAAADLTEASLE